MLLYICEIEIENKGDLWLLRLLNLYFQTTLRRF
jgi:hypothetical protein